MAQQTGLGGIRFYGIVLLGGLLAHGAAGSAESNGPRPTDPGLDPQRIERLVPEAEQAMASLPVGLSLLAEANYSFGLATAPDGAVYFTEYNRQQLCRRTTTGQVETIGARRGGMYGLACDHEGNLFIGIDSDTGGGMIVRRTPQGAESVLIGGLTRPRQLTCDPAGNLWAVLEGGQIIKWDRVSRQTTTVVSGLLTPQGIAAGGDGTIYYSLYGRMGAQGVALAPGAIYARRPDGATRVIAGGFWRARGLTLHPSGDLYLATEANAWDQGNSGLLVRIKPDGTVQKALQGLDYPQFPATGRDGRIYFTLARDNRLAAYDPRVVWADCPWPQAPKGVQVGAMHGKWLPERTSAGQPCLELTLQDHPMTGCAQPDQSGRPLEIWLRIPAELFAISRDERPYPSPETPGPGFFPVPTIAAQVSSGSVRAMAIVLRAHERCRWPMDYSTGRELPAKDFSEKPVAYLVHLEWRIGTGRASDTGPRPKSAPTK